MIISQVPPFAAQDAFVAGDGIAPIPQWFEVPQDSNSALFLRNLDLEPAIRDILWRLRSIFHNPQRLDLSTTDLHDLTCYVLHRLLASHDVSQVTSTSECVRSAMALYMLMIHGPTYFSHAYLQHNITLQLQVQTEESLAAFVASYPSLAVWLLSIGMVASKDAPELYWFTEHTKTAATTLGIFSWSQVLYCLTEILWFNNLQVEDLFRLHWENVWLTPT
jgi:hypothetical protein